MARDKSVVSFANLITDIKKLKYPPNKKDVTLKSIEKQLHLLSDFKELRNEHKKFSRSVTKLRTCAICNKTFSKNEKRKLACAHVTPVEEGGRAQYATYILPLCNRNADSYLQSDPDKNGQIIDVELEDIGCHGLYDKEAVWSRNQMRQAAQQWWRGERVELSRPAEIPKQSPFEKIKFSIDKLRYQHAERRLREYIDMMDKKRNIPEIFRAKAVLVGLFRRRGNQRGKEKIIEELTTFFDNRNIPAHIMATLLPRRNYEWAMALYFPAREFSAAATKLREGSENAGNDRNIWIVNKTQAVVADFEEFWRSGKKNYTKNIQLCIEEMRQYVYQFDHICKSSKTKYRFSANRWSVTARLHLARMLAHNNDPRCFAWYEHAVQIRDRQTASDGWSRYTTALLLHTGAECEALAARKGTLNPRYAIRDLSRASRWIIKQKYKNYEYLENVLFLLAGTLEMLEAQK